MRSTRMACDTVDPVYRPPVALPKPEGILTALHPLNIGMGAERLTSDLLQPLQQRLRHQKK
jgi:hypothetical protein